MYLLRKIMDIVRKKENNMVDLTKRFKNNVICRRKQVVLVFHWTASETALSAINWLADRLDGRGTVGYNYIIDRDGTVYMLGDPRYVWFHNTGLGSRYDSNTVSVAFVMRDESQPVTERQIASGKELVKNIDDMFKVINVTHHAALNSSKRDFPEVMAKDLMMRLGCYE